MAAPSTWHKENGFEFRLFPAKTAKPECLIIYLHGIGSRAEIPDDYINAVHAKIPGADVIALQAPNKVKHALLFKIQDGYSWLPDGGPVKLQAQAVLSHVFNRLTIAEKVEAFARAQLKKRGLTEENMAYSGQSMGAIVALQAGLSGDKPVAAIVSHAGVILPFTKAKSKPAIFLQMGEVDELFNRFPASKPKKGFLKRVFSHSGQHIGWQHESSKHRLKKLKVPFTEKIYPKMNHDLGLEEWKDGIEFMAKALKLKP